MRKIFQFLGFAMLTTTAVRAATKPEPPLLLPLAPLGVPAGVPRLLAAGVTQLTLNFVDENHLLLTYYTRGLLPRLADSDASDFDGLVAGVLLELPTGKELARTEWRVHDRNQYLWPLGHGRFLFRVRTRLSVLDPLANLGSADVFKAEEFGTMKRRIGYIAMSPGADLLAIETLPAIKPRSSEGQAAVSFEDDKPKRADVEINLYRLDAEEGHLRHKLGGVLASTNLIEIPANSGGYLASVKASAKEWNFDYISHDGKKIDLAPFDTSCAPRPFWVTRSEFVALGCDVTSITGQPELGGFDLRGRNEWISVLAGAQLPPLLVAAPEAGRFALSRVLLTSAGVAAENLGPTDLAGQEVTVRQSYDGRVLQKQMASPVQRSGQNFDLAPNGLALALVQNGAIAVYKVPALTGKDQSALRELKGAEPAGNDARIRLNSVPLEVVESEGAPSQQQNAVNSSPVAQETPAAERQNVQGDVPQERRQPPTLYDAEHPKEPR